MGLKRKRSFLSCESSDSSASECSTDSMDWKGVSSLPATPYSSSSSSSFLVSDGLNSRTRKRWRDNRPDEENVYRNTLQKLFQAQRRPNVDAAAAAAPIQSSASEQSSMQPQPVQKSTLHSFWNIPQRRPDDIAMERAESKMQACLPAATTAAVEDAEEDDPSAVVVVVVRCRDCDRLVTTPAESSAMGRRAGVAAEEHSSWMVLSEMSCWGCGRVVCEFCSVRLNDRRCLSCST